MIILIVIFSFLVLLLAHEFGHFFWAKYFGVKVDEFGVGLPPRIWGKEKGGTLYSINAIPFGAFVRIADEDKEGSYYDRLPASKKALILAGGVIASWLLGVVLIGFVLGMGSPEVVDDLEYAPGAVVRVEVLPDYPAKEAGLQTYDVIKKVNGQEINYTYELQDAIQDKELVLTVLRGKSEHEIIVQPEDGLIGVHLFRTLTKNYSWYQIPIESFKKATSMTVFIVKALGEMVYNLASKEGLPEGFQVMGPVGVGSMAVGVMNQGLPFFINLFAIISISLAIFNLLPIPALDGGRLLFLVIEKIRGKKMPMKLEQGINNFFFVTLLILMLIVTFSDIIKL
jgi:regulator of sigma E protease